MAQCVPRRRIPAAAVLFLWCLAFAPIANADLLEEIEFAKQNVYPALVNISVVMRNQSGGRTDRFPGAGSGVIVSAAGHVLTNFHVAGNTTQIHCTLPNGEVIEAQVVAHDALTDLSVLKLDLETRPDAGRPLPFATLGDSDALQVGEYVLAMGNPLTLSSSLTLGVVSNPKRVFTDFTGSQIDELDLGEGEVTGIFTRWIQHDALILPGNSGGPLVNLHGKIVGINELGGGGIGFAIPSNLAAKVLNHVMTYGEVRRGWIGCSVLPVNKLGREDGVLISSVVPSSPADRAGLRPGDVLLTLAGERTDVFFFEQVPLFYQRVAELKVDREVSFTAERQGESRSGKLHVERMAKFLGEPGEYRDLGITVREITGPMALARRFNSTDGVLVTGVRPGFPCQDAKPPLQRGDVIVAVGSTKLTDMASFSKAVEGFAKSKEMVLTVNRGDEQVMTVVKPKEDKPKTKSSELPKAWLGATTQVMTPPVAEALMVPGMKGFRVTRVYPWTEAEKSGLRLGDIILALNGEALEAFRLQDAEDLDRAIENLSIGEQAKLTVYRDGGKLDVNVAMEKTPRRGSETATAEQKELEFSVRDIVFFDRVDRKWAKDQQGVLVTDVTSGSWAQIAGLQAEDLIAEIDRAPVKDVAEFEKMMKRIVEAKPKVVTLFVHRGHRTHFVFIEPSWEKKK